MTENKKIAVSGIRPLMDYIGEFKNTAKRLGVPENDGRVLQEFFATHHIIAPGVVVESEREPDVAMKIVAMDATATTVLAVSCLASGVKYLTTRERPDEFVAKINSGEYKISDKIVTL